MSEEAIARVEAYVAGDDLWTIYNDTFGRNLDKHYADLRALLSLARQVGALEEVLIEARKWLAGQPDRSTSAYETSFSMLEAIDAALQSRSR